MLERQKTDELNIAEAEPTLDFSVSDTVVRVAWKKSGFDALELQYRKAGAPLWQPADKSTEKIIEFSPPLTMPGVPENSSFAPY